MGPEVQALEETIASLSNVGHGIGCASGTDALLLSLKTLDLSPGDEVITSPFTFFATAGAIHNAGGKPVFADIDPDTFNLDVDAVMAAVTERTRAIVPVHLFGQMAPLEEFAELREDRGIAVIEDAAQAIGARRRVGDRWFAPGELGTTACFSFFPSKNLGGWGDGGMIVTSSAELAQRLRRLRTHGGTKMYHHDEVGTNSRLDTLQAAVLLVKAGHLAAWNAARRSNAGRYDAELSGLAGITTPAVDPANEHIYHQYTIRAERRDELREHLKGRGIGCAVYYPRPLHLQPCFSHLGYGEGAFPVAEQASRDVLSLPIYPELTEDQQSVVIEAVRSFCR